MGFTTGFLGGFTLTASVLWLTISLHTRNRVTQAALLRQQQRVLKNVVEPEPPAPEPEARVVPAGIAEMAKDKWNRALETSLKSVYETDWRRVRESAEDRFEAVVEKLREQK
ncbi:hypothetical protein BU23DRAFT_456728 [Bimuria novae-zelandiae CBS 107.79]|uniref:MICOS complex subunit MIC12 n=1 Tax=Bimuria novae-zelandiae CBS 107.79 TaxID=1447943 RepID=A0A6A5VG00_9PLEO|nr:hypothetical protein BU23DRAFT_456728 [Bimuria novae-zelandiae CBS 107.79]